MLWGNYQAPSKPRFGATVKKGEPKFALEGIFRYNYGFPISYNGWQETSGLLSSRMMSRTLRSRIPCRSKQSTSTSAIGLSFVFMERCVADAFSFFVWACLLMLVVLDRWTTSPSMDARRPPLPLTAPSHRWSLSIANRSIASVSAR